MHQVIDRMGGVVLHLEHGDDALLDVAALGGGLRGRRRVRVREARPRIMVSLELHVLTWGKTIDGKNRSMPLWIAPCHCCGATPNKQRLSLSCMSATHRIALPRGGLLLKGRCAMRRTEQGLHATCR